MKLKYRLKNIIFPRKHNDIVKEIIALQEQKRMLQAEKDKMLRLMERGFLGDTVAGYFYALCDRLRNIESELLVKKQTWKNLPQTFL